MMMPSFVIVPHNRGSSAETTQKLIIVKNFFEFYFIHGDAQ